MLCFKSYWVEDFASLYQLLRYCQRQYLQNITMYNVVFYLSSIPHGPTGTSINVLFSFNLKSICTQIYVFIVNELSTFESGSNVWHEPVIVYEPVCKHPDLNLNIIIAPETYINIDKNSRETVSYMRQDIN